MLKKILISSVLMAVFGLAFTNVQLEAESFGKLDKSVVDSLNNSDFETLDILVKLTEQADLSLADELETREEKGLYVYRALTRTALSTQGDILEVLESENVTARRFYIVNMILVKEASRELIGRLATRNDVAKIYADEEIEMRPPTFTVMQTNSFGNVETNIEYVGANRVWDELGITGEGIVVAGQDTGIQWDHPALIRQYRGSTKNGVQHDFNWYDAIQEPITGGSRCGYATAEPCDDNAHGTHTLGTIIGDDGKSNKIGMAPNSQWVGCRNMDAGTGRPQTYMACFEFFLAPHAVGANPMTEGRPDLAPHVINNSWGCPSSEKCRGDVLLDILYTMKSAGVFVVVSAGNSGPGCSSIEDTPAWHSAATFSVGAFDHRNEKIAGFSSRGPSSFDGEIGPDIVAPGVSIRSAVPGNNYQGGFWSGTSMAGPHVAGLVALMWSANPEMIGLIDETARMIEQTANPIPSSGCMEDGLEAVPNNYYGYGVINSYEAVKAALDFQRE